LNWILNLLGLIPPLRKVVNYRALEKESLYSCPACEADVQKISLKFAQLDRYGFPAITNWCRCCDLLYLNPRPSPDAYSAFYNSGTYRRLIKAFSGKEDDHLIPQARVIQVVSMLKNHVPNRSLSVLNIGGTRADFEALSEHLSIGNYVCLNPGEEEAGEGYETVPQTLESYEPEEDLFDVICLLGTINHLTNPGVAFKKISQMMAPDSIFIFDFKDPIAKMSRMTQPVGGLQFDHATYPTRRTLGVMLKNAGLGLKLWHTENHRLYTFIVNRDSGSSLVDIFAVLESPLIERLQRRAQRLPFRLVLKVLRSITGSFR
jgi:hypothetical protein